MVAINSSLETSGGKDKTMAEIRRITEYKFTPTSDTIWYDVLYAKSYRLCTYTAEDLPKTARKWLEDKEGVTQYSRVFDREETIYEAKPVYRVVFDFRNASGDTVRDSLTNNGRGFSGEDASYIAQELAAQGNSNVYVALL